MGKATRVLKQACSVIRINTVRKVQNSGFQTGIYTSFSEYLDRTEFIYQDHFSYNQCCPVSRMTFYFIMFPREGRQKVNSTSVMLGMMILNV